MRCLPPQIAAKPVWFSVKPRQIAVNLLEFTPNLPEIAVKPPRFTPNPVEISVNLPEITPNLPEIAVNPLRFTPNPVGISVNLRENARNSAKNDALSVLDSCIRNLAVHSGYSINRIKN